MKTYQVLVNVIAIASFVLIAKAQTNQSQCDAMYNEWHAAVAAGPGVGDGTQDWRPNSRIAKIDQEIGSNRIAMAYFLCEKMANTQYTEADAIAFSGRLYQDVILLHRVAGIDLMFADDKPTFQQDLKQNILKFTAHFAEEWHAGIYKDPSKQIKQLCEARLSKQNDAVIDSNDLVAIRRYGIFGLPELERQIQAHNSKHAFAAYLIITGQPKEYADYLKHSNEQYTTATEKIGQVRTIVEKMKAEAGNGNFKVLDQICAALLPSN